MVYVHDSMHMREVVRELGSPPANATGVAPRQCELCEVEGLLPIGCCEALCRRPHIHAAAVYLAFAPTDRLKCSFLT